MMLPLPLNNTNVTCQSSFLWDQSTIDSQRPILYVCIIAAVVHSVFWLQLVFCSSVRQNSMQWLYAYLMTDILLLIRFFFLFILHTTSTECTPNRSWYLFVCYIEAILDNYLNLLEGYILLALNICRYAQIAYNKNVYETNVRLLTFTHVAIYSVPLITIIVQLPIGWAQFVEYTGDSCDVRYTNMYAQIFNFIIAFVLPISLNILVIYASVRYVRLTSHLRPGQHHVSSREKYHRSLVIQFLVFYTVWLSLWSPNLIVYQFASGMGTLTSISRLLNFIEITLDPIIISALDVRFYHAWKNFWIQLKSINFGRFRAEQRRVGPTTIDIASRTIQQKRMVRP